MPITRVTFTLVVALTCCIGILMSAGCAKPKAEFRDAMGIAIFQRLVTEFDGTPVECPPYFRFPEDESDGFACLQVGRDLTSEGIEGSLTRVLEDFGGWLQETPPWWVHRGRAGAMFGSLRGSSVVGPHGIDIGFLGTEVVIVDRMWTSGDRH